MDGIFSLFHIEHETRAVRGSLNSTARRVSSRRVAADTATVDLTPVRDLQLRRGSASLEDCYLSPTDGKRGRMLISALS